MRNSQKNLSRQKCDTNVIFYQKYDIALFQKNAPFHKYI